MTWNATGIMTGIPYLLKEMKNKNITICGISEHWLLTQNKYILDNISNDFEANIISCSDPKILNGRTFGKGGVAILWHKSLNHYVQIVETFSDRIAAIKLSFQSFNLYIIQVYLPCSNENLETFKSEVDKLNDVLSTMCYNDKSVVMGDFNAKFIGNVTPSLTRSRDKYV